MDIPHSDKRFAGFSKDNKQLDAEVHRKYIYGGHVAAYMRVILARQMQKSILLSVSLMGSIVNYVFVHHDLFFKCLLCVSSHQTLMEDEPEKYQSHFSEYLKRGIEADGMEELYKKVHAAIRTDPIAKKVDKQPPKEHKRLVAILLIQTCTCFFHLIGLFCGLCTCFALVPSV